jgi:hypothetical protein
MPVVGTTATLDQAGGKAATGRTPDINARRAEVTGRAVYGPRRLRNTLPDGRIGYNSARRLSCPAHEAAENRVRLKPDFACPFKLIWVVQSRA